MMRSRLVKILILVISVLVLSTSGAWAASLEEEFNWDAPRADMKHVTRASIVNGKTEYAPVAAGASAPHFYYLFVNVTLPSDAPEGQTGEFTLNSNGSSLVEYYNVITQQQIGTTTTIPSGKNTFNVWPWPEDTDYYIGGETGGEADFIGNSEVAFSLQDFSFQLTATPQTSGTFGKIRTTQQQMNRQCVPYVELNTSGTMLAGLNWRFVNPSTPASALAMSETNDVIRLNSIWVLTLDGNNYRDNINKNFAEGDKLEGALNIAQGVQVENIRFIELTFSFSDRLSINCQTQYKWRFYPISTGSTGQEGDSIVDRPTEQQVQATQNAVYNDLGINNTNVSVADTVNIKTTESVFANNELIDQIHTSSAIAVNQNTTPGGAVILGTELYMPVNVTSFSGEALTKPGAMADVRQNYHVYKTFFKGGQVDLLARYPSLFSYDVTGTTVQLNATVIIVDAEAPRDDNRVDRYYEKYGIMHQIHNGVNYLYIFDGAADGIASDPIALVAQDKNSGGGTITGNGGGSGGCSMSNYFIILLVFSSALLLVRKKVM